MKTNYMNIHTHTLCIYIIVVVFYHFISGDYHLVDMPLSKCSLTCELMNVNNN